MTPETRFVRTSDGTQVAYQVTGSGPSDILLIRGWISDIEHEWQEPVLARVYRRLESVGRLIRLDRRGTGMSDRIRGDALPTLEDSLDDIGAVMDACGSRSAVLVGLGDGSFHCGLFAGTFPDRTAGLVLYSPFVRWKQSPDYPWGFGPAEFDDHIETLGKEWATREFARRWVTNGAPSRADDERLVTFFQEQQARAGSARDAIAVARWFWETDITGILPAIRVPTLVIARGPIELQEQSRYTAERISEARLVEMPGEDIFMLSGDTDAVVREMTAFIESLTRGAGSSADGRDRVLATLLFSDIVGSTRHAAEVGDRAWALLLERYERRADHFVRQFRGRIVDTAGDGVLAAFDGPGRAIRCAGALVDDALGLGLQVRAGLHTGECEPVGDRLRGIAVHIGARVCALAEASEVLVTGTVRDLVAGSGFRFHDRGRHVLKGVPGDWNVFAVGAAEP